jgi:hypothetical protein
MVVTANRVHTRRHWLLPCAAFGEDFSRPPVVAAAAEGNRYSITVYVCVCVCVCVYVCNNNYYYHVPATPSPHRLRRYSSGGVPRDRGSRGLYRKSNIIIIIEIHEFHVRAYCTRTGWFSFRTTSVRSICVITFYDLNNCVFLRNRLLSSWRIDVQRLADLPLHTVVTCRTCVHTADWYKTNECGRTHKILFAKNDLVTV